MVKDHDARMAEDRGTILCGTDLSEKSDKIVQYASQLAQASGARILILHVVPPNTGRSAEVRRRLHNITVAEGVPFEHCLREGEPAEEIVKLAREAQVQQIVIGTRRPTKPQSATGEGLAHQVIESASCSVAVVGDEEIDG